MNNQTPPTASSTNENQEGAQPIAQPWTKRISETLDALDVSTDTGLSPQEVESRRERYGPNRLREAETRSAWEILVAQFKSLIVGLLAVAAVLAFVFGDLVEGLAIVAVLLINAAIGFVTEYRAVQAMEALQEMGNVESKVRRGGDVERVVAEQLVPGDVVLVSGGDVVTADLRLVEASKLQANESALTGESVPVSKQIEPLDEETTLAERSNMLFKGTAVTRGSGEGVVVATGMETELGGISSLVEEAEEEVTPLEQRLDKLGRRLIWVTLALAALVALSGIIAGKDLVLMIETAIALAVASIPEGLPIVATVALARGMMRMAERNALINRLSAVETLGETNVILTDKTGTLTENRMTITEYEFPTGELEVTGRGLETEGEFLRGDEPVQPGEEDGILREALRVGVLCNNASLQSPETGDGDWSAVGEPMEVALLVAGAKADLHRDELLERMPEAREVAFDPDVKMMATLHEQDGGYYVAVKGSAEAVLDASTSMVTGENGAEPLGEAAREHWRSENEAMGAEGLRILALAKKHVDDPDAPPYEDLTFIGLVGFEDPPRQEVRNSIEACHEAGIKVVMLTGDQPVTARSVAAAVGLVEDDDVEAVHGRDLRELDALSDEEREDLRETLIFARVSPSQKLDLIQLYQDAGYVVAMTGDGVNDAPALKKADIGVAMGQRGTQVAREAADMVLKDDAFSSIVAAVGQGRVIFDNIRNFVLYLLSCNLSEVLIVAIASLVNAPLPIRPLQILFLNLVTDVFPALALGVGEGDPLVMKRPPRDPEEEILTRRHWAAIGGYGLLITFAVLGLFALLLWQLGVGQERAVTMAFLTLALAQLWHVFNMRDSDSGVLDNDVVRNPYVWGAVALCVGLLLLAVYVPFLANVLDLVPLSLQSWGYVLVASLLPLVLGQLLKSLDVI